MSNDNGGTHSNKDKNRRIEFAEEDTVHPCPSNMEEPEHNGADAVEPESKNQSTGLSEERVEEAPPNLSALTMDRSSASLHDSTNHEGGDASRASASTGNTKKRRSSLELRKMPVHVLLTNNSECTDLNEDDSVQGGKGHDRSSACCNKSGAGGTKDSGNSMFNSDNFLRRTCLNSQFNLRTQMMLSFGLVSAFAILLVVTVCVVVSVMSGNEINQITSQSFEEYVRSKEGATARYLAESLTLRLLPVDVVHVLYEATRDRFAGYPIYEDDSQVPFWDTITQSNQYPIRGKPLNLEWQMPNDGNGNVDEDNQQEHVQHRASWYQKGAPLSTESPFFFVQGQCDPNMTDPNGHTYWQNCSDDNNNLTTGGVISPSPTTNQVYQKASDLGPLLKALYEFYLDVKELGIYFANSGTGATTVFPHYQLNTSTSYTSIGCNWLLEEHPYDNTRYIGTMEDHARCEANGIHMNNQKVSTRLYSPMDRDWCRVQAQNPQNIVSYGPYLNAMQEKEWLMSIGRAVYDRVTQEFIGCIGVDYILNPVEEAVVESKVTLSSEVTVVRWDANGTVVASSAFNRSEASENIMIDGLPVGVSHEAFVDMKTLVDFDKTWDPKVVRSKFENYHILADGFSVTAYPMPPPPEVYDKDYQPQFFAISSVFNMDVVTEVENVSDSVDDAVKELVTLTMAVGLIGVASIVVFIFIVSHAITLPMNYMNDVSSDIVNTFGSHNEEGIEMTRTTLESKWSPKTELSDVVKQFQKMVSRFSGSAMAKSMQVNVNEIDNRFQMEEDFAKLYYSRAKTGFLYDYFAQKQGRGDDGKLVRMPSKIHFGTVINDGAKSETTTFRTADVNLGGNSLKSPLFFWIAALIVTPLLITTVVISVFVTYRMSQGFLDIISEAQGEYLFLNQYALQVFTGLRASYAALSMRQSMRDNFLLTRFATWLLFGAIERTESLLETLGGTNDCKLSSEVRECSAFDQYTCDCAWGDIFNKEGTCTNFDTDTRNRQKTMFFGLAEDISPDDGNRVKSSYPKVAYSAESTVWWTNNTSNFPGSEKGSNASGYDTTYDRFRVMSAMPIFQTLYNADQKKENYIASTVFFEADGLGLGFNGCNIDHLRLAEWISSEENGASDLRPDLCPIGKHGFDPRCRAWYDTGRKLALNNTGLYVTPPYDFAGYDNFFGQTCTSPLIDPLTGENVGQTLIDFVSKGIFGALRHENTPLTKGGFPIVITGLSDFSGADTVIGPNYSLTDASSPLGDVVLPHDNACPSSDCTHRADFEIIRDDMKNGGSGSAEFQRTAEDGSIETVHMYYAPVFAKDARPNNSSDISRGINVSDFLVYSLALAEPEQEMVAPFAHVEEEVHKQIHIAIAVLVFVILFSTAFVVYISNRITLSMTEPMIYLLQLIVHINRINVDGSPPDVEVDRTYGSREIVNVVETMETLYKIVQSANVAYFAGDVEKAYYVLADAARLFKRLENCKAEGVANNNLGNTMLAFYRSIQDTGVDQVCGFSKREVIGKGMGYYHRAIQLGEKAYDGFYEAEGWSPSCLEFMQHLSNRYFNRAMFLLTVKDGHERPAELEELGFRDLQIAFDMDVEIVDQGTEVGWNVRGADKMFEVFLSRIRGHLSLLEMGYEDKWELDEALEKAFDLLKTELRAASSPLFKEFSPAGRMQQIEAELIRYQILKDDLECAAQIAIRMLVEDETTLQEAQLKALGALVLYFNDLVEKGNEETKEYVLTDLKEYQARLQRASAEHDKFKSGWDEETATLPASLKKSMRNFLTDSETDSKMEPNKRDLFRLSSLRASTRGDVTMEVF